MVPQNTPFWSIGFVGFLINQRRAKKVLIYIEKIYNRLRLQRNAMTCQTRKLATISLDDAFPPEPPVQ